MTALNAQAKMDWEGSSVGYSVNASVRKFQRLSCIPMVSLVLVFSGCREPSVAVQQTESDRVVLDRKKAENLTNKNKLIKIDLETAPVSDEKGYPRKNHLLGSYNRVSQQS